MSRLDLSGACAKLERALLYLRELGDSLEAMGTAANQRLGIADEETEPFHHLTRHLFRVGELTHPDPAMGLVVGDYIQNLRATLDHLAWEMVRKGSRPSHNESAVQFPIYSKGTSRTRGVRTFSNSIGKNLPGVGPGQIATIDRYQPYHRGQWHLSTLANLSNDDKHRLITPVTLLAGRVKREHLSVTTGEIVGWRFLPIGGRAVNERTPYLEVFTDTPDAEVLVHTTLMTHVAFRERGRKSLAPLVLEEIGETVAEIVSLSASGWGRSEDAEFCAQWSDRGRTALGLLPRGPEPYSATLSGMWRGQVIGDEDGLD